MSPSPVRSTKLRATARHRSRRTLRTPCAPMHQRKIARFTVSSTADSRWTAKRGFMSKVWLITGASRGLGRAFTEAILEAGDRVVAAARSPEQLVGLESKYAGRIRTVALDVTNEAQAKAAFEAAIASFGGLDVLVNNA